MINIQHINFRYSVGRPNIFEDFSLTIDSGNIVGLLGKNGTGKSTLLYLIAGLLRPRGGEVKFQGVRTELRRPDTLRDIFIVPEEFELPSISLNRYVEINRPFYPNFSEEVLHKSLADFELTPDVNLGTLSMGQKKKVFMSFALATCTRLLLMDEPTNGLDIPSKSQFRRVISSQMQEDRTIIISTHQVHDVETLLDRVVMIEGNRLLINETTGRICELLSFEQRPYGQDISDALYAEPSLAGTALIARGDGFQRTQMNLELLFNALAKDPDLLQRVSESQPSTL